MISALTGAIILIGCVLIAAASVHFLIVGVNFFSNKNNLK